MTQRRLFIAIILFLLALAGETPASARTMPNLSSHDWELAAPVLGSRMQLSTESIPTPGLHNFWPAIAYNTRHDEFLVVWEREIDLWPRAIYGRRVDRSGRPIGTGMVLLTTGPGSRDRPSVVYNATNDQYFLVYTYCNPCTSPVQSAIYGRILNYDLSGGTEFEIWKWTGRAFWRPRVAWSIMHDEYLVVWNAYDTASFESTDVSGRRYARNGTPLQNYVVQYRSVNQPSDVDLVYNPYFDEYLVTWHEDGSATDLDIYAARVKWDNTIERSAFPVKASISREFSPSVTVSQSTRYLVVWTQAYSPYDHDIYGRELDVHGDPVGDPIPIDTTTENDTYAVASARPGAAIDNWVVWMRVQGSGTAVAGRHWTDPSHRVLWTIDSVYGWIEMGYPTIATGSTGVLLAYSATLTQAQQYSQAYSRLWTADVAYIPLIRK